MSAEITSEVDLYDSERRDLMNLVRWLNDRHLGKTKDPEKFAREVIERFFRIGFHIEIRIYALEDPDTEEIAGWEPAIVIEARTEPEEEFDHDKMRYEVRSNLLGLNQQGNVQRKMVGQAGYGAPSRTASGLIVPSSARGPV